jgi:hypothetical protein
MTADVTQLHPPLVHFDSCDRDVYGRAVMHLLSSGAADDITAQNLRAWVKGWRDVKPCDCLALRIRSLETVVGRYRKAFHAELSEDNAERLAVAEASLARLRAQR